MDRNEITGETITPPCSGLEVGSGTIPILSAPLRAEDHGVLTWTCHCSDNLMHRPQPSSPRWGQVERGLPGEVHAVQLQQDLHRHGHAVR